MTKIIDLLQGADPSKPHVSIEFFPPRTDDGVKVRLLVHFRVKETLQSSVSHCLVTCMYPALVCSHGSNEGKHETSLYRHDLGRWR
jgi:hypothetical protein